MPNFFNHTTVDSTGKSGINLLPYVERNFKHLKNGKTYTVEAIVWNGATDQWALLHTELIDNKDKHVVSCIRDHTNFFSDPPRYVEVPTQIDFHIKCAGDNALLGAVADKGNLGFNYIEGMKLHFTIEEQVCTPQSLNDQITWLVKAGAVEVSYSLVDKATPEG